MLRSILPSALACVIVASAQPLDLQVNGVTARTAHLILFDGPGATETYPSSINVKGTVIGNYADTAGGHGFLRFLGGGIVTFDAPGSPDIYPDSINSTGAIAGNYGSTSQHGFLRAQDGTWTTFDVPGTFPSSSGNPIVINDAGIIAGPYFDTTTMHGFIRTADGAVHTIDPPGSTYTYATGINAGGTVTGIYSDATFTSHGFVREPSGQWITFDVPGNNFGFFPPTLSISAAGEVTGSYFQGMTHGFLWHSGGSLITFDVSGAAATQPAAINSKGMIAGSYQDSSFNYHGFVRTPSGTVYTFSIPGATETFVVGIDDSHTVAGSYQDSSFASHGFLLIL